MSETKHTTCSHDERHHVEYLETPVKLARLGYSEISYEYIPGHHSRDLVSSGSHNLAARHECFMKFHFVSPLLLQSAENAALTGLYCSVLIQLLTEEITSTIGNRSFFEITETDRGIMFQGCSEKVPLLLFTVMKHMVDCPNLVTKELFEVMKEKQLETLHKGFKLARDLISDVKLYILKHIHYTFVDMYTALRDVNFDTFQNFIKSFTNRLYIQCLVQGNITQDAVLENVQRCIEIINCKSLLPSMIPQIRVMQIPLGTNYCKLRNMTKYSYSVVINYYQAEVASIKLKVLLELLEMIMDGPLVAHLMAKQQLIWHYNCSDINFWGILGYCIRTSTYSYEFATEYMDQRIEDFLKSFNKILEDLSEEDLDLLKEDLRKEKQCVDIDPCADSKVWRNWREIIHFEYVFDRHEKEVLAMKDIKLSDLREWIAKHTLNGSNLRKLSIQVVGGDSKEDTVNESINIAEDRNETQYSLEYITQQNIETQDYHITDIEDYKKDLFIYPVNGQLFNWNQGISIANISENFVYHFFIFFGMKRTGAIDYSSCIRKIKKRISKKINLE